MTALELLDVKRAAKIGQMRLQVGRSLGTIEIVPCGDFTELVHLTMPAVARRCESADEYPSSVINSDVCSP